MFDMHKSFEHSDLYNKMCLEIEISLKKMMLEYRWVGSGGSLHPFPFHLIEVISTPFVSKKKAYFR